MKANDFRVSPYFSLIEFQCPCCKKLHITPEVVYKLSGMRNTLGKPIVITSGYRCKTHNRKVKGHKNSQHLYGQASDVFVKGVLLHNVINLAFHSGFSQVYLDSKDNYVHCGL